MRNVAVRRRTTNELTFAQIAEQLGLSPHTAASRYRYALGALRQKLNTVENHG